jgi:hypothetical protein
MKLLVSFAVVSSPGTAFPMMFMPVFTPADIGPYSFMSIIKSQFGDKINNRDYCGVSKAVGN